jgi:hypothetical protein
MDMKDRLEKAEMEYKATQLLASKLKADGQPNPEERAKAMVAKALKGGCNCRKK